MIQNYSETRKNEYFLNILGHLLTKEKLKIWDKRKTPNDILSIQTNCKIVHSFSAGFLNRYVLQKHTKKVFY